MSTTENGNGEPLTLDDLKRKDVSASIFETTLSTAQCARILKASAARDINFRRLSVNKAADAKITMMVESMKKGRWVWTDADPLRLHVQDGEIVCTNGQHRLTAAVTARRSLHTLVMWGDQWRAGVHVDRNRPRNVAQYLQHDHGLKSSTLLVAASRLHLARVVAYREHKAASYARTMLEDEDIIDFVLKHQDVLKWTTAKGGTAGARGFSTTGYHCFLLELWMIRPEIAEKFHADLTDPNLDATDPLNQLRRAISRRYSDTGLRASAPFTLGNMVKAHNMRAMGEHPVKWVVVRTDEVTFPAGFEIDGKRVKVNQ